MGCTFFETFMNDFVSKYFSSLIQGIMIENK